VEEFDAMIPNGQRCPPNGKQRCPYRGWHGWSIVMPYCEKYKAYLVQGRTKNTQLKCAKCLAASGKEIK